MKAYQQDFIELALANDVLRFGEFTLKSGRLSPYFFNAGNFNTASGLERLGHFYAAALVESGIEFDMVFGPAYKGIPLACATAIALVNHFQRDVPYSFNRKEVKDHGEGGNIVGAALKGRVLIIDDVITAGTAVKETLSLFEEAGVEAAAVMVALDRQERGKGKSSAIQELQQQGLDVISLITLNDLIEYLNDKPEMQKHLQAIEMYREEYGV